MADSECTPARTDFTSTLFIIQGLGFGEDLAAPGRVASVCRDRHDDRSPGPPVRHPRFHPSRFSRRGSTIDKPPGPGSPDGDNPRTTNHQSNPPLTFPPSFSLSSYEGLISKYGQVDKLTASDANILDIFGESVAISGDTIVVGADQDDDGCAPGVTCEMSGSAYVFRTTDGGATYVEVAKLTASDAASYDNFGGSVAISGNTVVVVERF